MSKYEIDADLWQLAKNTVRKNDAVTFSKLLKSNKNLALFSNILGSLLHLACEVGNIAIVKQLILAGADVNLFVDGGGLPLSFAACEGHTEIISFLVEHGAVLDTSTPDHNPLFAAIYSNQLEVVELLVALGVDVHATYRRETGELKNALSYALDRQEDDVATVLRKAGARLPSEDIDIPIWPPAKRPRKRKRT